ncbi:MAG: GDSL-type esterase/lipase family protein [Bacteroidetes bacterium]|nr:GDSL-type esterase/lipase family protein [Bacteroidota bacterium]
MKYKSTIQKAGLIICSILLSLLMTEIVLRWLYPQNEKLYVWQPNLQHTFLPDSTIFYGVNGAKNFSINAQGFRGDEFENDSKQKYLCLGGSTTECLYLDNTETWFQQFATRNSQFEIGSIGKSGSTTREHFIQLKYFVPQLGKIDGVILMVGLNDMMKRLSQDWLFDDDFKFNPELENKFVAEIFLSNKKDKSWWRRTRLFQLAQRVFHRTKKVEWENVQDDNGAIYKTWRKHRQLASRIIDSLPDLTSALNEYERNLQLIYDEVQKQKIKLVLINQATLYKDSMNELENNLLWMGGIGEFQHEKHHAYYSAKALNKAMLLYNDRMKTFCATHPHTKLIDFASQLPKDTSVFYDDCHFNENGARKVAKIISRFIKE